MASSTTEIFQNGYSSAESWAASGAYLTWATTGDPGTGGGITENGETATESDFPLYLTSVTVQYTRELRPLYPINFNSGSLKKLTLIGNPSGRLDVQGIIGPTQDVRAFLEAAGASCFKDGDGLTVRLTPYHRTCLNTDNTGTLASVNNNNRLLLTGVVLQTYTLQIQSQEAYTIIQQPLSLSFNAAKLI